MTAEFFEKPLAARQVAEISGMIELDIPVHEAKRGWFKESKGIFVPRGVANGFQFLSENVSYSYLVNDYWALELKPKYAFVNYADPTLGIEWADVANAEVSEADKNHPLLKDVVALQTEQL